MNGMMRIHRLGRSNVNLNVDSLFRCCHFSESSHTSLEWSKRSFLPLIKSVHPDKYAQEKEVVQATNLSCVQALSELWRILNLITVKMRNRQSLFDINNESLLRQFYNLNCFVRKSELSSDNNNQVENSEQIKKIVCSIKIPSIMLTKGQIRTVDLKSSFLNIYNQIGLFYLLLGLTNPFENEISQIENNEQSNNNNNKDKHKNTTTTTINGEHYDADELVTPDLMTSLHESALRSSFQNRRCSLLSHYNTSNTSSTSHLISKRVIANDVSIFAAHGNIRVKEFYSPLEELKAVVKLKDFIVDYAGVINFRLDLWQHVIIVICNNSNAIEKDKDVTNRFYDDINEALVETPKFKSKGKYSTECHLKEKYVVEVPSNFRASVLCRHITDTIPYSNVFYGTDDMSDSIPDNLGI